MIPDRNWMQRAKIASKKEGLYRGLPTEVEAERARMWAEREAKIAEILETERAATAPVSGPATIATMLETPVPADVTPEEDDEPASEEPAVDETPESDEPAAGDPPADPAPKGKKKA